MHLCNKLRSLNRIGRTRIQKARELTAEVCCKNFIEKNIFYFFFEASKSS
jgi:hypothetical protein